LKSVFNRWFGLDLAMGLCGVLAAGSVALAFLGAEGAGQVMSHPVALAFTLVLACALTVTGIRSATRHRLDSALLHLGCACVMAGWLAGRIAERTEAPDHPVTGSMAMIDGDVSDKLWGGPYLTNFVGRLSFSVKLEKFFIEYYPSNATDLDAGRMPPVREYRSRVTITEPGQEPYVMNVRVNHPVKVQDYLIYQMSWGQSTDSSGRPVTYTVLQFIRDPGLPVVYGGFVVLLAGLLLFAVRVFRLGRGTGREVPQ